MRSVLIFLIAVLTVTALGQSQFVFNNLGGQEVDARFVLPPNAPGISSAGVQNGETAAILTDLRSGVGEPTAAKRSRTVLARFWAVVQLSFAGQPPSDAGPTEGK